MPLLRREDMPGMDAFGNRFFGGGNRQGYQPVLPGARRQRQTQTGGTGYAQGPGGGGGEDVSYGGGGGGPQSLVNGAGYGVNGANNPSNPLYRGPAPTTQDVTANPSAFRGTSWDPGIQVSNQPGPPTGGANSLGQNAANAGGVNIGGTYYPPVFGGATGYNGPAPTPPPTPQQLAQQAAESAFRTRNPGATIMAPGSDMPAGTNQGTGGLAMFDPASGEVGWRQTPVMGGNTITHDPLRGYTNAGDMYDALVRSNPSLNPAFLQEYSNWAVGDPNNYGMAQTLAARASGRTPQNNPYL